MCYKPTGWGMDSGYWCGPHCGSKTTSCISSWNCWQRNQCVIHWYCRWRLRSAPASELQQCSAEPFGHKLTASHCLAQLAVVHTQKHDIQWKS
jgi:hypothetical protein